MISKDLVEEELLSLLIRFRKIGDNSILSSQLYATFLVTHSQMQMYRRLSPRLSNYSLFLSVLVDDPKAPDIPPRVRFTFRHNDRA